MCVTLCNYTVDTTIIIIFTKLLAILLAFTSYLFSHLCTASVVRGTSEKREVLDKLVPAHIVALHHSLHKGDMIKLPRCPGRRQAVLTK